MMQLEKQLRHAKFQLFWKALVFSTLGATLRWQNPCLSYLTSCVDLLLIACVYIPTLRSALSQK